MHWYMDMSEKPINSSKKSSSKNQADAENSNQPILLITYIFAGLFILLIGYIVKYMVFDSEKVIANSYNKRLDILAEKVIRGEIITSDGVVIATNTVDNDGNTTRYYPYSNMFAHSVGFSTYGKSGLELSANYYLLTSNANILERISKDLQEEKNTGDNVITTLNFNLQQTAYNALGNAQGAVVVMEPSTGKILAMVSKPDFDPNDIENIWSSVTESDDEENSILLNRATQGLYPPGSTFKIITALEFIRENKDYENYSYNCEGQSIYNNVSIECYNKTIHGEVNLADSIAYSCNDSFANIGISLNADSLNSLCDDFLYNENLPYDGIYNQSSFVLNSKSDKSLIPQTVIGQGDTQITPLHNALIMSTIANGGIMMKPYLIDSIETYNGIFIKRFSSDSYKRVITTNEADIMKNYLSGVVEYGTATMLNNDTYTVAGKTGTAEYNSEGKSHSWFVGFSNIDNPDIVISVVVEDEQSAGISAKNIAKQIFDAYYYKLEYNYYWQD